MASFMDYYQDELRKRGGASSSQKTPSVRLSDIPSVGEQKAAEQPPQSPVNWVLDMLARSTYGMTQQQKHYIDQSVSGAKKIESGNWLGGAIDIAQGMPNMNPFTGPFTDPNWQKGFFNFENDPELKRTSSDNIEYAADEVGKAFDPKYVDVENNVDARNKAGAGLVLDIFGDPLTYVSGTGLIKGAGGVVKGVDRALSATSKGLFGGKGAAQAVESAVKSAKARKARELGEENPFDGATNLDPEAFRPSRVADSGKVEKLEEVGTDLARVEDAFRPSVPRPAHPAGVPERLAIESGADAARGATQTAKSPIEELLSGGKLDEPLPKGRPVITKEQPALADELLDENGALTAPRGRIETEINASPARAGIADVLTKLADDAAGARGKVETYREWSQKLPDNHLIKDPTGSHQPVSLAALKRDMELWGNPANRSKGLKEKLDRTLSFLKHEYQSTVAPRGSVVDALSAFTARAASEKDAMRNALGGDLYDFLAHPKQNSPARFQKMLEQIRAVIEPGEDIQDVLRNMDQNLARILTDRLGTARSPKAKTIEEAAARAEEVLSSKDPYQHALAKGLAKALDAELVDLQAKGYIHYLKKLGMKVGRTSQKPGEGLGRYVDQLNGFSQYTMLRNQAQAIDLAAEEIVRARGIKGQGFRTLYSSQRTEVYKEAVLRVMADQAQLLDDIGAHMSIGTGINTVQLSMSEVYRGLLDAAKELGLPKTIDQGLFNYGTQAAPTAVSDAVAAAIGGASRDEVFKILTDPRKYGNKGLIPGATGARPNNLIDSGHGWGFTSRKAAYAVAMEITGNARDARALVRTLEAGRKSSRTGGTRGANHYYLQYGKGENSRMAQALTDTIMRAKDDLALRAAENEMNVAARTRGEIHKLSGDELAKIESFLKDPSGTVAKIKAFAARKARMEAEAAKINASPDAVKGAEEVVDAALGEEFVSSMSAAAKAEPAMHSSSTALDLANASDSYTDDVWEGIVEGAEARPAAADEAADGLRQGEEWADVVDEGTPLHGDWRDMTYDEAEEFITKGKKKGRGKRGRTGKYVDLSQDAPGMVDRFGDQIIDPYGAMKHKIQKWFNQNFMAENVMPLAHAWQNSMSMRTAYVSHQLNAINKAAKKISSDPNLLRNTFAAIQRGDIYTGSDEAVKNLDDMIRGVLGDFFDLDAAGSMGNVFLRTTNKPQLINDMLKQKGIDEAFDLDAARKTAAERSIPLDQALSEQWRSWDVKDPLDFMHRMSQARQELAFNRGVAKSFMQMAKEQGAVSNKAAPGFVRLQASGKSRFMAHLPQGTYVKKELAEELRRVEEVFRTSREFQGQLGDFVRNTYAPLLNAWKFSITLPRPGHHIRNLIGDTSVTWMRRGGRDFTRSWKDAVKLLATRNNYTDVNMLEAATRYGLKDLPKGGDTIISTEKFGDFTADELYAMLAESGALPSYHIGEDFLDASGGLNKVLGKATLRDTVVGEKLGKLSEGRDHLARFQHFIQALRQDARTFNGSREQLIQNAVKEVIKYHPDASLLTPTESKLRLAIPFYSWFGKILPALMESMVMHPGRLSNFNKASYNWAVANGLDPESLSDPFPDDQLFPSFLTEQALGPQFTADMMPIPGGDGQYIRMNPGIAHLDVMNTLGADPIRGIAGMTSPLIRVPAELLSGGSWGTGAQINDWSDYLDQSIPGVNYISNITGVSPTGSVESVLKGEGLDEQAGFAKGNKTDFDRYLSVANWITGLGMQNLSRPNYINYAEIEKRNAASEK